MNMNRMACFHFALVTLFLLIILACNKSEAKVSAIIAFGDSAFDNGNNNHIPTLAKADFEPYGRDFPGGVATGRFSNGRIAQDFISQGYGLKPIIPAYLDPSLTISDFASGVCFASASSGYDNLTSDVLKVIPLWKQVEYFNEYKNKLQAYVGQRKANWIISEALYLFSMGTNDFLENYYLSPKRKSQFTIEQYQDFLLALAENFVSQIYGIGARKLALIGLAPLGCFPVERSINLEDPFNCNEERNRVAVEFNGKLKVLATKLNREFPGLKAVYEDVYDFLLQLIKKPSQFGFEVSDKGCCGTGLIETGPLCNRYDPFTCPDANKYVFWDSIHPTERAFKLISDYLLSSLKQLFR